VFEEKKKKERERKREGEREREREREKEAVWKCGKSALFVKVERCFVYSTF